MSSPTVLEELARIAHRLWCDSMLGQGWRSGLVYDEAHRVHDAIVDFDKLTPLDRHHTLIAIESLGIERQLERAVEYPRGPAREFSAEEMRRGLPVGLACSSDGAGGRPSGQERGLVESWEIEPATGLLKLIRVRWADGTLSEHFPSERELRRL